MKENDLKVVNSGLKAFDDEIQLIVTAHAGQFDKGGLPYYLHPIEVMRKLPASVSRDVRIAALFHDLFEDTSVDAEYLRSLGYSESVITMVNLLSRDKSGQTYMEFIQTIVDSGNKGAIQIKIADNEHNSEPARIAQLPPEQQSIVKRYEKSLKLLRAAL